jgi:nucleoid-associated protein YgaU
MSDTYGGLVPARIYEVNKDTGDGPTGITVSCMFNPFEYTVSKSNTWEEKAKNKADVSHGEFKKAGSQTLKLSLTFDTYAANQDVSKTTNQLWKLMETKTAKDQNDKKKIEPPHVAFEWGVFKFVAVITDMTQKFTLFKTDGTPVRAKVDVTFKQFKDFNDYPKQNPTSGGGPVNRVWRVIAGDRLDTIAAEVYGDATQWRRIAERNRITNPLWLRSGQQLTIPEE